jgi:hypothetical protein
MGGEMRFVPGIEVITHLLLYNFSCILINAYIIPTTIIPKRLFQYLSIMHYHYFALFQQAGILSALVNNFRRIQKITLKVFELFSGRFW